MRFIRSLLVLSWMVVTVIPVASLLVIGSFIVSSERVWWWFGVSWLKGAIWVTKYIGGVNYRVRGEEYLPDKDDDQRIILCPKHQSTWETFFFPSMTPHPLAYVFKKELLQIPFFGWALARLEMVHIDRSAGNDAWAKVAAMGEKLMDRGKWMIMFPEGTRTERGIQGGYKTGASRLAIATDASIIPIAVASGRCWPRRSFWLNPGVIDVSIGPPITPKPGQSSADLMREVEIWIEAEMRIIDPEAYPENTVTSF